MKTRQDYAKEVICSFGKSWFANPLRDRKMKSMQEKFKFDKLPSEPTNLPN